MVGTVPMNTLTPPEMERRNPARGAPAPVQANAGSTPVLPLPDAQRSAAERLPPPPLYQCNTVDNDSYLSDTPDPKPRCVRVDTVGIGAEVLAVPHWVAGLWALLGDGRRLF